MALQIFSQPVLKGYYIKTAVGDVNLRTSPDSSTMANKVATIPTAGILVGTSTGRGAFDGSTLKWIEVDVTYPNAYGKKLWVFFNSVQKNTGNQTSNPSGGSSSSSATNTTATAVNNLVQSDVLLFHKLLVNARYLVLLQKKGYNINPHLVTIGGILQQYNARQTRLKSEATKYEAVKTIFPWAKEFTAGNPFPGLGDIGLGPLIIVAIVVVSLAAGAGILAWLQPAYDESKANLKVSDDLAKVLENVDPKVKAEILADLESQIDNAYNHGKTDQWWNSFGGIMKVLFIAAGTFAAIKYGPDLLKKKKSKK